MCVPCKGNKKPLKGVKKELILGNLSMVWQQWAVDLFHIAEKRGVSLLKTDSHTRAWRAMALGIFTIFFLTNQIEEIKDN